jgi:hypothetical protein
MYQTRRSPCSWRHGPAAAAGRGRRTNNNNNNNFPNNFSTHFPDATLTRAQHRRADNATLRKKENDRVERLHTFTSSDRNWWEAVARRGDRRPDKIAWSALGR